MDWGRFKYTFKMELNKMELNMFLNKPIFMIKVLSWGFFKILTEHLLWIAVE